ncbi:MAG: hypothetical protein EOP22_15920 [Hyphomicrobiales bacterium]|nr:MAG: hypothetical protein EOP22_15920 [Hyphomicrobiales bacterium]
MPHEVDHRVAEALVAHAGHRHQKLPFEGFHSRLRRPLIYRTAAWRQYAGHEGLICQAFIRGHFRCIRAGMFRMIAALSVTLLASPVLAGATDWQEIAPGVTARLISSDTLSDGLTMAGLELVMPAGTKTYWRIPGETGIPTEFDFSASTAVTGSTVHWPFPEIDTSQGYMDYVYHGTVVLPVELEVSEGAVLDTIVTLGICSDICVPATARFTLPLTFAGPDSAQTIRLDQAMAQTPVLWDQPGEPVSVVTLGPSGSLYIEAPNPALDPAKFIADVGDPAILFETPQKSPDGNLWTLKPLGGADTKGLEGSPVQLTFLTPTGPYAVTRTIVSSDPA